MDVACVKATAPLPGGEEGRADPLGLSTVQGWPQPWPCAPWSGAVPEAPRAGGDPPRGRCLLWDRTEGAPGVLLPAALLSALSPARRGVSQGLFGEASFQAALGRRGHLLELEDVF